MGKNILLEKGDKFNHLTVIELVEKKLYTAPNGKHLQKKYYRCVCDCGKETIVYQGKLISGQTKSCGCQWKKHGLWKSRLYNIWRGMQKRCELKTSKDYARYGGRGIAVCKEWKNDFLEFYNWAMNNGYKQGLSIERKNNNGNYCPENCCWATLQEQAHNKRTSVIIEYKNEKHNVTQWANILNIPRHRIYERLKAGWNIERVLGG